MTPDGLATQRALYLPLLAQAHSTLTASASMGQLLRFEEAADEASKTLATGIASRRPLRVMKKILPNLAENAAMIAAEELGDMVAETLQILAKEEGGATEGLAMARAVLLMAALDRARLATAVAVDLCEGLGFAPNGKALPTEKPIASAGNAGAGTDIFASGL